MGLHSEPSKTTTIIYFSHLILQHWKLWLLLLLYTKMISLANLQQRWRYWTQVSRLSDSAILCANLCQSAETLPKVIPVFIRAKNTGWENQWINVYSITFFFFFLSKITPSHFMMLFLLTIFRCVSSNLKQSQGMRNAHHIQNNTSCRIIPMNRGGVTWGPWEHRPPLR